MRSITDKAWIHKYAGLSTDVKPVSDGRNVILNGSIFVEMDTSDVYMYDDEHRRWIRINTSSSGGSGGQVSPEDVDRWLEENISQETGYVLDRSLTMQNAAAPADMVGQLKTALSDLEADKIDAPSSPASGAFLVWNGTAWVAQTLATWQGGSY